MLTKRKLKDGVFMEQDHHVRVSPLVVVLPKVVSIETKDKLERLY